MTTVERGWGASEKILQRRSEECGLHGGTVALGQDLSVELLEGEHGPLTARHAGRDMACADLAAAAPVVGAIEANVVGID
jgi:hypothetical protein